MNGSKRTEKRVGYHVNAVSSAREDVVLQGCRTIVGVNDVARLKIKENENCLKTLNSILVALSHVLFQCPFI